MYMKLLWLAIVIAVTCSAGADRDPLSILSSNPKKQKQQKNKKSQYKDVKKTKYKKTKKNRYKKRVKKTYRKNNLSYLGGIDLKNYTKHKLTDKPYLELKAIDGPLPKDYAPLYLKSKTLQSITRPQLKVIVDVSDQRIYVYSDDIKLHTFKTSTARRGYYTVRGTFKPKWLSRMHYSKKYHNSPMPWSVFFHGGYAIHGTNAISRLGRPASHGCVRAHPSSAKQIFRLIQQYGKKNTTIIVRN